MPQRLTLTAVSRPNGRHRWTPQSVAMRLAIWVLSGPWTSSPISLGDFFFDRIASEGTFWNTAESQWKKHPETTSRMHHGRRHRHGVVTY
jgi:hypothetical protein